MGRKDKEKHVKDVVGQGNEIPTVQKLSSEEVDLLLPILKKVIVTVYPSLGITLEILYLMYDHAERIVGIASCLMEGDTEGAIELASQIVAEEMISTLLNHITDFFLEQPIQETAEIIQSKVDADERTKDTVKKVVQGTLSGIPEAVNEKIAGDVVENVRKSRPE